MILQINIDPESLKQKLPSRKDLKPYPSKCYLEYLGHSGPVKSISVEISGQWLASGSCLIVFIVCNDVFFYFMLVYSHLLCSFIKVRLMEPYVFGRLKLVAALKSGKLVILSIMLHGILCLSFLFWRCQRMINLLLQECSLSKHSQHSCNHI